MSATHHTLGALQIPRGLIWKDEFEWQEVETSADRGITGALILDAFVKTDGRPITLVGSDNAGWVTRADLLALQAMVNTMSDEDQTYEFTHADGREFTVRFGPGETPVTSTPIGRPELPTAANKYVATIRLITV